MGQSRAGGGRVQARTAGRRTLTAAAQGQWGAPKPEPQPCGCPEGFRLSRAWNGGALGCAAGTPKVSEPPGVSRFRWFALEDNE